jgi:hypothetical protein
VLCRRSAQVRNWRHMHLSMLIDYLDGGDNFRRGFLSTSVVSSCVCSSSMFATFQHVCGAVQHVVILDAVSRSPPAVVLIFFVLMDPSASSIPLPCITRMNQSCHGGNLRHIHTSCENVRHSAGLSVQPFPVPSSGFHQSMPAAFRSSRTTR